MDLPIQPIADLRAVRDLRPWLNPYYNATKPFRHDQTHTYVVTRLIGYDLADCERLVSNSLSARPLKGPFWFVKAQNATTGGYLPLQTALAQAANRLQEKGFDVHLDDSFSFPAPADPMAGYASWGSNDHNFRPDNYRALKFSPGAIATTFVSTSARTFKPTHGGQSLIADLVHQGVTGVAGYVTEPYAITLHRPEILFDRYVRGFNLGESFAASSPILKWKEIAVGDPLCRPYGKQGQ